MALTAFVALLLPAVAAAHATLLRVTPANGSSVTRAPRAVTLEFDDSIHVGRGNAAVANATGASVLAGRASARGRVLTIPLHRALAGGAYTVRWSIVSNDGHHEEGVLAFAVGATGTTPRPVLTARTGVGGILVAFRALYYLGLLTAAGATIFALLTRRLFDAALERPLAQLLFVSFLIAFIGASAIVHSSSSGTRFALVLKIALTVLLVGGAAAALAPLYRRLFVVAGACALGLLTAPTLSGHALDPDQPRGLAAVIDVAHASAAAIWLGGLASVLYVVPRAAHEPRQRAVAVHRFSTIALLAVIVLAATGVGRAVTELRSVEQIWSTSYGRALLVKTILFVPLLGVGWLNRTVLLNAFQRLRRAMLVEVAVLAAVIAVVSILTELRPGSEVPRAQAATAPLQAAQPPALPPVGAIVDARELGTTAVAVARLPGQTVVTLVGPDGTGVTGRAVTVDGTGAEPCGAGCYSTQARPGPVAVAVDGRSLTFSLPDKAPSAATLLAQVTARYRASRSIVFDERLASSPTNAIVTRFEVVSPHRLTYRIRGGPQAIVIDARRWDRSSPSSRWQESQQTPLDVTQPYWHNPTNVHLVGPNTLTFLSRDIPAWFRVTLDASHARPTFLHMTAASHFMTDTFRGYDVPVVVSPPSR